MAIADANRCVVRISLWTVFFAGCSANGVCQDKAAPRQQREITALIESLQDIKEGDVGYMPTMSGSNFLPLGNSQAGAMLLGQRPPATSETMRKLVTHGFGAVPELLARLEDKRPTKIVLEHGGSFGGMLLADEYDYNRRTAKQAPKDINTDVFKSQNWVDRYTVTVGDLCFVALGQIVNRHFNAVRYQPTAIIMVNSPAETPSLRVAVKNEWGSLTAKQHEDSLRRDFLEPDSEDRRLGACLRLGYYYPDSLESLALRYLTTKRYDSAAGSTVKSDDRPTLFVDDDNSLARLINALALFPSDKIDHAVRAILHSTDEDYLASACARYLVGRGADNDIKTYVENRLKQAQGQRWEELQRFLDRVGWTPLHVVAETYESERVAALILKGANVNARAANGQTPLHVAADHGAFGTMRALLAAGANPNLEDERGRTPLQLGLSYESAAEILLEVGAVPTEILGASFAGRKDLVAKFLQADPSAANARKPDGETSLHLAARRGHIEVAKLLISSGADVNAVDNDRNKITPLHWAASYAGPEMVALLLEHDADAEAKTWDNRTPLVWARDNRNKEVSRLLQRKRQP